MYNNDTAVQLHSFSDYYEQSRTFSSDKVKYGVYTKYTDIRKYVLKTYSCIIFLPKS